MAALFYADLPNVTGLFSGHLWCRSQIYQCGGKMVWVSAQCQILEVLSWMLPLKETGLPWMDSILARGYMIRPWLMTPVQRPTTRSQRRYNFAHSSTRTPAQRSIGMAKQRWHCLRCGLRLQPQKACKVILVCFMLYNCTRYLKLPPPPHDTDNWEDDAGDEENDENPSLLLFILVSFYPSITECILMSL